MRLLLALRAIFFVLLLPGTVAGYVPFGILRAADRLRLPELSPSSVGASILAIAGAVVLLRCVWDFFAKGKGTLAPIDAPRVLIFRKVDTMSRPMADSPKPPRKRRRFDAEFKEQAARLVLDEGKSVGAVARDLDLTETALREWVKRAQADRTKGRTGLTTAERDELVRLRRALRIAEEERDILKKATAFFAKQSR